MDAPASTAAASDDDLPLDLVDEPGPTSGPWSRPRDWRTAASLAVVAVVIALPLRSLFKQGGSPMEEGFMLVFPERLLAGDVPNRDFLYLYGPGSLWVLGAVYKVFGTSLAAERVVGLIQQLGIVFGVFALARPFGRPNATVCAVTAVFISLMPIGLTAMAWDGGVALAVVGLVVGLHGRRRADRARPGDHRVASRLFVLAGGLGAAALLYRPDLILAVMLAYGAVAWGLGRPYLVRLTATLAGVLVVGYGAHLVMAGPGNAIQGMLIDPVFELRGGRRLPSPPSWDRFDGALTAVAQLVVPGWSFPALSGPRQVVVWFYLLLAAVVFEVALGLRRLRADRADWKARLMLAAGLLGLGMIPQALQRPDATHLAWVSSVPVALLPMYLTELVRPRLDARGGNVGRWAAVAFGTLGAVVVLFAMIPYFTVRPWTELTRQTFKQDYFGFDVHRGGRNFYLGSEPITPAAQGVVDALARRAEPGDRLFVGTGDLRKTPYSDAYLYHLFPELTPATRYIELDPGVANAEDSGLADDVASADWLILSHVWDNWSEPNDARKFGSDAPNRVVERDFCLVERFGNEKLTYFLLYERCR